MTEPEPKSPELAADDPLRHAHTLDPLWQRQFEQIMRSTVLQVSAVIDEDGHLRMRIELNGKLVLEQATNGEVLVMVLPLDVATRSR